MATIMTSQEWDAQFARQAAWTRSTRSQLYRRARLMHARRVLDVGSGTGTVTEELASRTKGQVIGLDLDPTMIAYSQQRGGKPNTESATRTNSGLLAPGSTSQPVTFC